MYPVLFKIGPVTVGSYSVMMALGFLVTCVLLHRELNRRGVNGNLGIYLTVATILGGITGAKLWWLVEHPASFSADPLGSLLRGGGLVWNGGLILGATAVIITCLVHKKPVLMIIDSMGPLILLGYAFGRMGCFVSGDGDYGPPSNLPWAMAFPNGLVPTPPSVRVHPTPLYEIAVTLMAFLYLRSIRMKRENRQGYLFGMYLILSGCGRFVTEFWRLTPMTPFGLTVPQTVSLLMILSGIMLIRFALSHNQKIGISSSRGGR